MARVLIAEISKHIGEKVTVAGWVNALRSHGGIVFLDLRDRSGVLQIVCKPDLVKDLTEESVISVLGEAKKRPPNMQNPDLVSGEVELKAEKIEVIAKAEVLPFDLRDLKVTLPTLLDFRPLTLRNPKIKAIFEIEDQVIGAFRENLKSHGFTEFESPTIVPATAEGGAEVFHVDYFKSDAYLAQSPQLYKQILVPIFERVFTVARVFRAEPSVTTRHLTEYISLDAEMGFIESWQDLMDICENLLKSIFSTVGQNCAGQLKLLGATLPQIDSRIPRLKMREAQEIILERTGRDQRKENDLSPDDEKEICAWAKEKHGSELVFITHYPVAKRPFYTYADPQDPDFTLSFDILCRGLEITTGGQRINDYQKLMENLKKWGNDQKKFEFYLQAFKYGMPQEGGFALGAERVVKQILGLENIREASLFPRDMIRIDQRLATLKEEKKPRAKVKRAKTKK
jgi:nondiscriminating aspartyl-tRNA synthetase